MRIVFSKDRAAQLDLLLVSLARNAPAEETYVLYRASSEAFEEGYRRLVGLHRDWPWSMWRETDQPDGFEGFVRWCLSGNQRDNGLTTFLCDDDILYRQMPDYQPAESLANPEALTFSLRLGRNCRVQYPTGFESGHPWNLLGGEDDPWRPWRWSQAFADFAYPGSLDGHVFRTADLRRMLDGRTFPNPTALECALVAGCETLAEERPLMDSYPHSILVGNPVNRTSEQSGVRFGVRFPAPADELNRRFLAGERLDLDALDFTAVDGAHTEIQLTFGARASGPLGRAATFGA